MKCSMEASALWAAESVLRDSVILRKAYVIAIGANKTESTINPELFGAVTAVIPVSRNRETIQTRIP